MALFSAGRIRGSRDNEAGCGLGVVAGEERVMIGQLGYDYRPDGNFLISEICRHCHESFDVYALSPMKAEDAYGLCPACESVRQQELPSG